MNQEREWIMRGFKISGVAIIPLLAIIILMMVHSASAAPYSNITFKAGAYVIDMGSTPGSLSTSLNYANGLKPYGLIYDLVINKQVPVYWAINPNKQKDGNDFTVSSNRKYRGGSFIIPAEYASLALPSINAWIAKGVKVDYINAQFEAPIYDYITSFPNAVCDLQNGPIIIKAFYLPAEIPSTSYRLGSPQDLGQCDDIYAMPHADPQKWTTTQKTTFLNFIRNGGFLWAACHAVSAMESPAPTYLGYYFLSSSGLIPWGSHSGPTLPYTYNPSSAKDPVMQFIGKLDNALQSGSEQVYLPRIGSGWRATSTTVAVSDPTQADVLAGKSPGPAGIVIYGRAEGNPSEGFVTYETSHSLMTGNTSENVDAARVYGNTLVLAGIAKRPNMTVSVPAAILSGQTVTVKATITGGRTPYSVAWSSSCGGTFANSSNLTTTFTAPTVTSSGTCILRVAVKDACSRKNFAPNPVILSPTVMAITKTDFKAVTQPGDTLNYSLNYSNIGATGATGVNVTDLLPSQLTYVSSYPAPTRLQALPNGTTLMSWYIGAVAASSGIKTIKLNATVKDAVTGGSITNKANLSFYAYQGGPFNIFATDTDDIVPITKSVNQSTILPGGFLGYSICAGYEGTKFLTNAKVMDTIPAYTTYVTGSVNAGGSWDASKQTITWNLGSNQKGTRGRVNITYGSSGSVRVNSTNDTDLNFQQQTQNDGSCTTLIVNGAGGNSNQYPIIYFPKPVLPVFSVFDSATLSVYVTTARVNTYRVYRLNRDWFLRSNSALNCSNGNAIVEGIECNAVPGHIAGDKGGSTWANYNYLPTAIACSWTTAGGDYDSSKVFGTFSFVQNQLGRKNANITNLVRGWYNGTYANQGIELKNVATTNTINYIGTRNNTVAIYRPWLNISYTLGGITTWINQTVAARDTDLDSGTTFNYGYSQTIGLNSNGGNNNLFPIMYFNPPILPQGAVFKSATLSVYVTTAALTTTVNIYRMTRYWYTGPNSEANRCCDGYIVEGNSIATTPTSTPGATYAYYKYAPATAYSWTTAGGDKDSTIFGTIPISNTTAGRRSTAISNLVRGWLNGTYAVQGILIDATSNAVGAIASREYVGTDYKPYIRAYYHIPGLPGSNVSLSVTPLLLGCSMNRIKINMTVNVTTAGSVTPPIDLNWTSTNGITAVKVSGPTPTGPIPMSVGTTYNFTYYYQVTPGTLPGSIQFSGKPSSTSIPFASATSNTVLVTPSLMYGVKVYSTGSLPTSVQKIPNNANISDTTAIPSAVFSKIVNTSIIRPAGISIAKVVTPSTPSTGYPGTNVNFTITVTNTKYLTLDPVQVTDTLPAGLTYVSSNGSSNGNIITWNIGPMAPSQIKKLYLNAQIDGSAYGTLTNGIGVIGTCPNGTTVNSQSSAVVTATRAGINVTKSVNITSGIPCNNSKFYLNVTNDGTGTLDHVFVMDMWADGLEYKSNNGNVTSFDLANNTIYWRDIGPMTAGQIKRLYVVTHITGTYYGEIDNLVYVSAKPSSGANVTALNFTFINALQPSILINKTVNVSQGPPSTDLLFTINVTNIGEVKLNPVDVTDTLPSSGLDNISVISSNGTLVGKVITWSIGPLNKSQKKQLFVKAHIDGSKFGRLNNTVSITGTSATGLKYYSTDVRGVTAQVASISVAKSSNVTDGAPSTKVNFFIDVTNTGNATLKTVLVNDTLPTGLDYVSSYNATGHYGNKINWSIGPLNASQVKRLYFVGHINGAAYGPLTNNVYVTGKPYTGNSVTNHASEIITAKRALISVDKNSNVTNGAPSTKVNFTMNVTNTGEILLSTVCVNDTLPNGLNYVSSYNGTPNAPSGNKVNWSIGPLNPGQKKEVYFVAHINGAAYGTLTNNVGVTGIPLRGNPVTNTASKDIAVKRALISVDKNSNVTSGAPSTKVNFTMNVTNTGEILLSTVYVNDTLPTGLEYYNKNNGNGTPNGNKINWSIGPLDPGQKKEVYFVAHINGAVYGPLTNNVGVKGIPLRGDPVTNTASKLITSKRASILVDKKSNVSQGAPSTNVNFTINVTNTGQVTLNPVNIVDTLPTGLNYVSSNGTNIGNTVTWSNIGPMNPGQLKKLYLVAHINGAAYGSLNNTVSVTGTPPTGNPVTANAFKIIIAQTASIAISKTANVSQGAPSTKINFTINITNTGQVTMSPVKVVDTLPYGLNYVSSNGTAVGNVVTWNNIGPLSAGLSRHLYLVAHINGSAYGVLTNRASVTATSPTGLNYSANDTRNVTALRASLLIQKTFNLTQAFPHQNVNITINATNTGEVALNPVTMLDEVPNSAFGVSYVSSNGTFNGTWVVWDNIGPLYPHETKQMFLIVHVTGLVHGIINNTVFGIGTPPTGDKVLNQSTANMTVLSQRPDIDLRKTARPNKATYLKNINFTIHVTNVGDMSLDPIAVIDTLPIGLTYSGDDRGGTVLGKVITWSNVGPLGSNNSTIINLSTFVDGTLSGYLTNVVTVIAHPPTGKDVIDNETAVVEALCYPNISITKTATPKTVGPGGNVTFIINTTNTGEIPLPNVRVVDVLPMGLAYVSDNRSGTVSGNVITWNNLGPLALNESTYIRLNATVS